MTENRSKEEISREEAAGYMCPTEETSAVERDLNGLEYLKESRVYGVQGGPRMQ